MSCRSETSIDTRKLVIRMSEEGKSLREIAKTVQRSHGCIQKIIRKYQKSGLITNKPGRGRKEILSSTTQRNITRQIQKNPKTSAVKIATSTSIAIGRNVSAETIRRVLRKANYHGRVARKKPFISKVNRDKRIAFATKHISEPADFWKNVIFSDESKFNIFGSDGQCYVWRKPNSELLPQNTIPTVKHGGGSVLVWGCMSANGVGNLVFVDGIMDKMKYLDILKNNLKQSAQKLNLGSSFIFQQDNDPKHTAKIVQLWLLYNCKMQLHTPPQSPDLNVIENLWSELGKICSET